MGILWGRGRIGPCVPVVPAELSAMSAVDAIAVPICEQLARRPAPIAGLGKHHWANRSPPRLICARASVAHWRKAWAERSLLMGARFVASLIAAAFVAFVVVGVERRGEGRAGVPARRSRADQRLDATALPSRIGLPGEGDRGAAAETQVIVLAVHSGVTMPVLPFTYAPQDEHRG